MVVFGLGLNYVYAAFGPTSNPPNGNVANILNSTTTEQSKGGSPISGSMLDVSGNLAVNSLAIWNNATISGNLYIDDLHPTSGKRKICVDEEHKLTTDCLIPIGGGGGGGGTSWSSAFNCFIADTLVTMADGSKKNIQDVKIGDVLKGETTNNVVLDYHRPPKSDGIIFGFNGEKAFVTEEHPFKTTEGWKSINPEKTKQENIGIEVTQLAVGDTLITENGLVHIYSIETEQVAETTPLFNFKLSGDRTYFADGYLVHNKNVCAAGSGNICLDVSTTPYLFAQPGNGGTEPTGCSNIGQIYFQSPDFNNPSSIPDCAGYYLYDGCYSGGVNGYVGIRACGNSVPN